MCLDFAPAHVYLYSVHMCSFMALYKFVFNFIFNRSTCHVTPIMFRECAIMICTCVCTKFEAEYLEKGWR